MSLPRFRWVFCQLDTLRQCLPQCVRQTLNELPESLDETYERVMMELKRTNQAHAYRMLQCLTAATRPLSVAELAELLAFDFDGAKGGIPKLNSDWRWGDHEEAVLSTCSSFITVVPGKKSPVVQFSHFSVKEFLMSDRLATSTGDISHFHISLPAAHAVLAQACLGVLLRDSDVTDIAPLAGYAAENWVAHAQVENVASKACDGMESLFDPDKPYFEAWVQLHDVDLVEQLLFNFPQCASSRGGHCGTPLHLASYAGRLQVVRSLLRRGMDVNVGGYQNKTALLYASWLGRHDVVQFLLDHGADVNSRDDYHTTPLHFAANKGHADVVQVLLEHNANVNSKNHAGETPLFFALHIYDPKGGYPQAVRLLLVHGANVNVQDADHETPLLLRSKQCHGVSPCKGIETSREVCRVECSSVCRVNDLYS
ncbi:ankyrin repeat-containing domain protein [Lactarius quietus]|nr:ankyrin repeat-containing domain protein [Lactarius quietus]